jgi:hypothetical protein
LPNIQEKLRPGSDTSNKILKLLRSNFDLSHRHIAQMYPTWDTVEGDFRSYRMADDEDRESEAKNGVRKIIVPIQFATAQIMLTFLMEIFYALPPFHKVAGADPASVKPGRIMELCLDYDHRGNRGYFLINQWFLNALRYGFGVIENTWGEKDIIRKVLSPTPGFQINLGGNKYETKGAPRYQNERIPVFQGNQWRIVDPRLFYPDPRVSLGNFQDGIFCGHRNTIHDMEIADLEDQGIFFNTSYIKRGSTGFGRSGEGGIEGHNRDRWRNHPYFETALTTAQKDGTHVHEQMIARIIPRDFELDDEDRPQDWKFNVIDGEVIVTAEVNPFQKFPYSITETYPDILAFMSQGIMEFTEPLAKHINFLFNSHMANVRRVIKDLILVDPTRINIDDLLDTQDGGFVRVLQAGTGQDPSQFAKQLQITDITSGHFTAVKEIMELWERFTGANAHMFGQISSGRRTAYELQGVFRQAGSRMKMMADLMSCEGVAPLTEQMALLRQENMSMEQFMEIAGKSAEYLGVAPEQIMDGFIKVLPRHINGVFNFPAQMGVLPQDRAAAAETLEMVFQSVASNPWLSQGIDMMAIFKELVREKGLHHLNDFLNSSMRTETMLMTPDQLAELYATNKLQALCSDTGTSGRKDQGVEKERATLSMQGALNGAGASYN